MTDKTNEIKFALEFPRGRMLFMKKDSPSSRGDVGAVYFQPDKSTEAFMVWGERKELFGKHAISVAKDTDTGTDGYNVVHEFAENGALTDARLVTKTETLRGYLADVNVVQSLNEALAQDKITLHDRHDTEPNKVYNVAQFPDGRLLIQLRNKKELYLGTPGNYTKVDAVAVMQGGCSLYYKTATGESINLPYGFGGPAPNKPPEFKGEKLTYLKVKSGEDPAKFGLDLSPGIVHLSPFLPQLAARKPQRLQQKFRP